MTLRAGLIGTGYWADTVHAAGLADHPGVELAGVWGRDGAKAAAVAQRHGTTAETELDALLAQVDMVSIAVAPDVQAEFACAAADAGCHLLLEKPLALSVEDAERIVAACEHSGVASLVFFTARFAEPTVSWFRDVVEPGEWDGGALLLLASIFNSENPFGGSPWRRERGALWDIGPHALASLAPALGPVEKVVAVRGRGDTVHLALAHAGGRASSVTLSLTVCEPSVQFDFGLWGPDGVAHAPSGDAPVADAYARAISELLSSVETGRPHACNAAFGADVVRTLAAAERFLG